MGPNTGSLISEEPWRSRIYQHALLCIAQRHFILTVAARAALGISAVQAARHRIRDEAPLLILRCGRLGHVRHSYHVCCCCLVPL
eukprot:361808-Chlamydomonas_euryale.AAC.14